MRQHSIPLKKRKIKFILYLIISLILTPVILSFTLSLIKDFSWFICIIGVILLFTNIYVLKSLIEYFNYGKVELIVESDGKTIHFYNINTNGKIFNKSKVLDLTKMKRFYIVKKIGRRHLITNYSYEFEGNSVFKYNVNVFPQLFEAAPEDRNSVLFFVKEVYPEIELGYENIFQKMTKK